jgi:DNA transformation protein and related proteins
MQKGGAVKSPKQNESPVSVLRNLGPKSAMLLREAGVSTLDELKALGAVRAYMRVKTLRPKSASLNLLWALAAGLEDRDWRNLSAREKSALLAEIRKLSR